MWPHQSMRSVKLHSQRKNQRLFLDSIPKLHVSFEIKEPLLSARGDTFCKRSSDWVSKSWREEPAKRTVCAHASFFVIVLFQENVWKLTSFGVPPQAFVPATLHVKCRKRASRKDWGEREEGFNKKKKKNPQSNRQRVKAAAQEAGTASHYLLFRRAVAVAFPSMGKLAHIDKKHLTTLACFFFFPQRPHLQSLHLR